MTVVQVATVILALIGASICRPQENGASLQESEERCVNRNINQPLKSLCVTKECIEASNRLWQNMDATADPCQDFNQFACGGFIQNQIVPEDKGKLSSFTPATEEVYRRTRVLMDVKDSDPVWKTDKKVIDHFKSCMDQEALEEKGLTPVKDLLKELGGWPVLEGDDWNSTNFEWYDYSLKSLELGVSGDYILDAYIYRDSKNISYRVWYIDQPSLGMSREYLVKGFDDKDVQHYYNYMVEAAKLMGANEVTANASMKEALLFEIQIAKASTAREFRRDPNAIYHPETLDKYVAPDGYPNVKKLLESVMKSAGVEDIELRTDEKIIIEDPDYIKKSSALLTNTDKRVIANYLGWRVLKARIFSLNKAARKLKEDYNRNLKGIARDKPVWKSCLINSGFNTYSGTLVGAAGSMYARKYFKKEEKTAVEDMIGYLRKAFAQIVRNLDWMDDETKVEALKKLDKMDQYIAYPNEVLDQTTIDEYYKELVVTNDFFENELNQNKFSDKKSILRLREKYDPKHWTNHDDVAVVNAFYSSGTNSIKFPAGILQDLFFSSKVPKYLNYGAIGGVIGHEITHGFDDKGRKKDFEGMTLL